MKRSLVAAALIVAAGIVAYHGSFGGPFIFDDVASIPENPTIEKLWPPGPVLASLGDGKTVQGRPLLNLSFAINHALGGEKVAGYHAGNLLVHLLAALALYGVVRRTLLSAPLAAGFGAASSGLALAAALLWTVHPLQTESVTYIVQRAESLVGLFYLLTLYASIRALEARRPAVWSCVAVACCLAGMASKEIMATAPLAVVLWDLLFAGSPWRGTLRRRAALYAGLFAGLGLLAWLVLAAQGRGGTVGSAGAITPWTYALTQAKAVVLYARLVVWPDPLVLNHGTAVVTAASRVVPQLLAVAAALGAVAVALRRAPWLGFWGAWFFLLLAPSSSVVPVMTQTIAEHRMYLPLAGPLVAIVLAGYRVLRRSGDPRHTRVLAPALVALAVLALAWRTIDRNRDYRSELSIWRHTVRHAPDVPVNRLSLGAAFEHAGRLSDAAVEYREALRLDPNYADAWIGLGSTQAAAGERDAAIESFRRSLELRPGHAGALYNLANALAADGRLDEAVDRYREALRHRPDYVEALNNLGLALAALGRWPEAIARYEAALALRPGSAEVHTNLGNALVRSGRPAEALERYREALRLDPGQAAARRNLEALANDLRSP